MPVVCFQYWYFAVCCSRKIPPPFSLHFLLQTCTTMCARLPIYDLFLGWRRTKFLFKGTLVRVHNCARLKYCMVNLRILLLPEKKRKKGEKILVHFQCCSVVTLRCASRFALDLFIWMAWTRLSLQKNYVFSLSSHMSLSFREPLTLQII